MKYLSFIAIFSFLFGFAGSADAFTLDSRLFHLGDPILINGAVASNLYSVFWISNNNPNDEACAYIYGQDLTGYYATDLDGVQQWVPGDNDLTHYGTCFQDTGSYKIVELTDQGYTANYPDSRQSEFYSGQESVIIVN